MTTAQQHHDLPAPTRTVRLSGSSVAEKRAELLAYFTQTWELYESLLDCLVDDCIEAMMAIGMDEMSWDDLDDSHYAWPSVEEVRDYRGKVKSLVTHFIQAMPLTLPIDWESPAWVIIMGIEHERIHPETSSMLMRQLPIEWVKPQPQWPVYSQARHARDSVPANSLIAMPGGGVTQGKSDDTYG
ncbi:SAM-dependent methyltransferase|nr:SAM-dependent methyltransferase [Candidatus Pantoea persica]